MQGKSRRILILATSYLPLIGGAELAIKHLTDHLPEFSFDLITARNTLDLLPYEKMGNVHVYRAGNASAVFDFLLPKNFLPLAIFFAARRLLALHRYDLVYVLQASQAGGAGWLLKTFGYLKQPLVLNIQEGKDIARESFLVRLFRRLIIGSADYHVVISNYLKHFLIERGVKAEHVVVIPNGIDISGHNRDKQELKNKLGLGAERIVITVSRLVKKNGLADLIKAMTFVKGNSTEPVKLLIVGDAEPQLSLEADLKNLTETLGLNSDVIFVGSVDNEDVSNYLSLADVFVRPSRSEGLGSAFLEAMAAGVPIVGTPVGGIPDFLKDGETGLMCEVGNPKNIGDTILRLLNDRPLSLRISQRGRELVERAYTWDIVSKKFKEFYEKITQDERHA